VARKQQRRYRFAKRLGAEMAPLTKGCDVTTSVIVGGSSGLGRHLAAHLAARGEDVIITSRSVEKAASVAAEIGPDVRGIAVDLAEPTTIAAALVDIGPVDNLVISAIVQANNTLADFSISDAITAITVKLVGYTETVRVLSDRLTPDASVVLFGGVAKDRPYPGSTIVTTFNAGLSGLVKTLAVELAPHRVNVIHPGVVGNSPRWAQVVDHPAIPRTPIGRLVTMDEIVDAVEFLLRNTGVNAVELDVNGGLLAK
jgi:NAD(P)-dependent dehydrogenase (short-subunit alcohol dehydrogenase family)